MQDNKEGLEHEYEAIQVSLRQTVVIKANGSNMSTSSNQIKLFSRKWLRLKCFRQ